MLRLSNKDEEINRLKNDNSNLSNELEKQKTDFYNKVNIKIVILINFEFILFCFKYSEMSEALTKLETLKSIDEHSFMLRLSNKDEEINRLKIANSNLSTELEATVNIEYFIKFIIRKFKFF
jgi:hypothetical protein